MTTERSDKVWEIYKESLEKFDYFLLGLIGALCAYLTQNYKPGRIDINSETLELIALLCLIGAGIEGFNKIQSSIEITKLNHCLLREQEKKGDLVSNLNAGDLINKATGDIFSAEQALVAIENCNFLIIKYDKLLSKSNNNGNNSYKARNRLILFGFLLILISKVWSAY